MKNLFLFILLFTQSLIALSQNIINNDTLNSNILIDFSKVKPSFKEANIAFMDIKCLSKSQLAIIKFEIPSFIYRANTSLNDYCVIETKSEKFKLQNKIEADAKGNNLNIYSFTLSTTKDSVLNILNKKIVKITFYFTPNKKIEEFLLSSKSKLTELERYYVKLARRTLKYKISKPNQLKCDEIIKWLSNQ